MKPSTTAQGQSLKTRRQSRLRNVGASALGASSSGAGGTSRRQRESFQDSVLSEPTTDHDLDSIVEVTDENQHLRYTEDVGVKEDSGGQLPPLTFPTKTVYVRRPLAVWEAQEVPTPKGGLLLPDGDPEEPLEVYDEARSLERRRTEALHNHQLKDICLPSLKERALMGQRVALGVWEKTLDNWNATRLKVGTATSIPADSLLMARPMPLPPIQNHLGPSYGPESDFPQWRQKERFYQKDAFFLLPERVGPEEDGLMLSLPWSQRQLYKPPVTMVRPSLGEQPPFEEDAIDHPSSDDKMKITEEDDLTWMWVKGEQIQPPKEEQQEERLAVEEEPECSRLEITRSSISRSGSFRHSFLSGTFASNNTTQYYVRNTVPAFKLNSFIYIWGQPSVQCLVEIGVVANAGERGITHIHLANVGCCVIRYSWRHVPHKDHFTTGRYRNSPFIFNFSNGCLLPEQKLSIPVQFYSSYAGCWTERWMLSTTPRVYNQSLLASGESEIPVSLWGQALEVDINLTKRQNLDKELNDRAVLRMAERYVYDLVRFLPIGSYEQRAREELRRKRQEVPWCPVLAQPSAQLIGSAEESDPVATFNRLNPSLHYHSAAMAQVVMARYDLHNQLRSRCSASNYSESPGKSLAPQTKNTLSVSGTDKSGQRQSRARKLSCQGLSPNVSSRRQRRSLVTRESVSPLRSMSSSMLDQDLRTLRQQVYLGSVCRDAYQSLTEDTPVKEEVLAKVNNAMLQMSSRPFRPPMLNYKHLVVRTALAQLLDTMATMEWRLRCSLGLQDDQRFQKLATFPDDVQRSSQTLPKKRMKSMSPSSERKRTNPTVLRKYSTREKLAQREEMGEQQDPINWEDPLPSQYRHKLFTMVYSLLETGLPALLPVVTFDGYCLNPFLSTPKL